MINQLIIAFSVIGTAMGQWDDATPLCKQCTCEQTTSTSPPDIDCTRNSPPDLFNKIYWEKTGNDGSNSTLYPIGTLKLANNDLRALNESFPKSELTALDLTSTSIKTIQDMTFCSLQDMESLILSDNDIENFTPDTFKGLFLDGRDYPLRSLKVLKLDRNQLHTLHQDTFQHSPSIEVLDISYNPFKVIDQQTGIAIGSLNYLKELRMSSTEISVIPDNFLHTPKHLTIFDISGNGFETIPRNLQQTHELEVLCLSNNPIVNITEESGFPVLDALKVLHLSNMPKLNRIGSHALGKLERLEELHLSNNIELVDIDPAALVRTEVENEVWPPIKKLFLQNNKLTHVDLHLILHWEGLVEMDIRGNPWTCECENQWMIDELLPIYLRVNQTQALQLICAAPIEMKDQTFFDLYNKKSHMRCLDLYGNRPERDATILVGVLIGVLIGIPLVLFVLYAYQRHWFGIFDNSPASYSRQFYSRTHSDEL